LNYLTGKREGSKVPFETGRPAVNRLQNANFLALPISLNVKKKE